ncbi:methylenetetrahydrofolate reductase [Methylomonas paludis]|uniref:Methylenetetrahydrofolate reductase n=1 Tax=Methylomonas paludis TaxID=1173101 RepID=A0A975MN47_9GAMM|nr:methylenetetrahydrofolate reductase [Methylomonas paludis]QWF70840.1 methylenetetrahydrofolate reductase [Methylomonas paludis]
MKVSFEIVPRSWSAFSEQYRFVESLGSAINIINVPDIQRFSIRSWEVGSQINTRQYQYIPHLRAIDFKLEGSALFRIVEEHQLSELLLVSGDPPEGLKREFYNTNVVDLIRVLKRRFPELKIYAGFDPHRQGLQDECQYIQRKIDVGAGGFFSQPFYDPRLIEIYADYLQGQDVYIGISPITSPASMNYWEVKNKVLFPRSFRPDYAWNIDFANQVLQTAATAGLNIYFMPIRIDLQKYFSQIKFPG